MKAMMTGVDCLKKVIVRMLLDWTVAGGGCGRRAMIVATPVM